MGGRKSRVKGQSGEREFFALCNEATADLPWPYRRKDGAIFFRHPLPRHGAGQTDNSDPHGVLPVATEVKFVETPQFTKWFNKLLDRDQTEIRDHQTPVLAWRKSREPWTCFVVMEENEWKRYLRWRLTNG
jgi:hypothetical protein